MNPQRPPIKLDVYVKGALKHTEVLNTERIKIGRLPSSDLCLDDALVSMLHAVITAQSDGSYRVFDLSSTHGSFVNGERITERALRTGDVLCVGASHIRVTVAGEHRAPEGPPLKPPAAPAFDTQDLGFGQVLEVMSLWGQTVVDVQHIHEGRYLIGPSPRANHPLTADFVQTEDYVLAERSAGEILVHLPERARVAILLKGQVMPLDELAAAGRLGSSPLPHSRSVRLPPHARCRVEIGEMSFLVSAVSAAPPVARGSMRPLLGGPLLMYLLIAGVMHALFFVVMMSIPEDADRLHLDGLGLSSRFVEFMWAPEANKPPEVADPFQGLHAEEDSGGGERARPDEGQMGAPEREAQTRRFAVEGEDARSAPPPKSRTEARAQALQTADAAFAQLSAQAGSVWQGGEHAVGRDAVDAMGGLFGDRIGEAQGFSGLGLADAGRGAAGLGERTIGIGQMRTVGRSTGQGEYGRAQSRVRERPTASPKVMPGKPTVSDGLDREVIRRVVRQRQSEYRHCYERELKRKPDLQGTVVLKFTIAGNGHVIAAKVEESTMQDREVEQCITQKVSRWIFPATKGGSIVVVRYPFRFKAS